MSQTVQAVLKPRFKVGDTDSYAIASQIEAELDPQDPPADEAATVEDLRKALEDMIEVADRYCSHGNELGGKYNDEKITKARAVLARTGKPKP